MSPEQGTFGRLTLPSGEVLFTVEQPWRNNAAYRSCVPCGRYHLIGHHSPKYGETWALEGDTVGVSAATGKPRFACIFHRANIAENVQGCIGPGIELGAFGQAWGVLSSRAGMERLRAVLAAHPLDRELLITWAMPFGGDE